VAACAFRFLRQPRRPNAPRADAKRGNEAGSGVSLTKVSVKSTAETGSAHRQAWRWTSAPISMVPRCPAPCPCLRLALVLCSPSTGGGNQRRGRSPEPAALPALLRRGANAKVRARSQRRNHARHFCDCRFQQRRLWNAHIDVVVIRYNRDDAELRHDVQRPTASVLRLLRKELQ
jgi:hypothetical protein